MKIQEGWRFNAADFSMQAAGTRKIGYVQLVRDPESKAAWHALPEEIKDSESCPRLYINAEGETLEEAIINVNLVAAHTPPVN